MRPSIKRTIFNFFFISSFVMQILGWFLFLSLGKEKTFFLVNGFAGNVIDVFFFVMTLFGEWPMIIFVLVFVWFKFRAQTLKVAIAYCLNGIIAFVLKNYVFLQSARPAQYFEEIITQIHFSPHLSLRYWQSFPSGHTFTAFTGLFFIALLLNKPWAYISCFFIALLTGISRIYNGMHFPEDVLAGALLGVINTFVIYNWVPQIRTRSTINEN